MRQFWSICIMDKREKQVKERIAKAMIDLSAEKSWDKITITDIIRESKVARATFYRNFGSMDDLVTYGIGRFREDYWENAPKSCTEFLCPEMLEYTFDYYRKNRELILSYYRSGSSNSVLDIITESMVLSFGDMPSHSISRYRLYYYAGALYNMTIYWLENGMKETAKEMATAFLQFSAQTI